MRRDSIKRREHRSTGILSRQLWHICFQERLLSVMALAFGPSAIGSYKYETFAPADWAVPIIVAQQSWGAPVAISSALAKKSL